MLLQLSDEYVATAFALAQSCTHKGMDDAQSERYCDLMATGMGCLESILRNFRLPDPRKECRIRLRLATLMFEETENDMEAEEMLSKGVSISERSRLTDLKFAMQHLLARVMFKTKPKAALKAIEKVQHEVEALGLVNWMYAFRFLSISLLIQRGGNADSTLLLRSLTALASLAEQYRHAGVHVTAALVEAIVHLRSKSEEALDLAQRALATARTYQLDPTMHTMPQIPVLLSILDLASSLRVCRPKETATKLDAMQKQLDPISKNRVWSSDGHVSIPLGPVSNSDIYHDTAGIFALVEDGTCVLSIRWMAQANIYALGFLLSGIVSLTKTTDHENAIKILQQAIKCTQMKSDTSLTPLSWIVSRDEELRNLELFIRLHLVFAYCATSRWALAAKSIQETHDILGRAGIGAEQATKSVLLYLQGVCKQGTGDLQGAMEDFGSPLLCAQAKDRGCTFDRDIQTLSTLNKVLILRSTQAQQHEAESLLNSIQAYCTAHDNKALGSAFHIIKATTPNSGMPIVKVKQQIQAALNSAQVVSNNQLLCIIMNTMTLLFFKDIVGQQALKCGNAGRTFANKVHDPLWKVVADAMYGDTLERCGELTKAGEVKADGEAAWVQVPQGVKDSLQRQGVDKSM
ncbi:hypothetical protein K431DRAFT_274591 [Polychaeton citri CBS 116435]|uniref:Cohesin loading factor n=1 Tax=Polychaeton citri CBS 116435 TaxID=1314669 RepID=A0A9P4Q569_9PEZI|nr:hypothetical protein K431DRAFT_274591 [Polychaeton citri CBS 116435]